MDKISPRIPEVIETFNNWYIELSENDKTIICDHLRFWLGWDTANNKIHSTSQIKFSGRYSGPASSLVIGRNEELTCSNCGTQIKVE